MATETMVQVCARLAAKGYGDQCRAEAKGLRFLGSAPKLYRPEDVRVDEVVRLEGNSTPDEESMVFALSTGDGRRATWCVAHGSDAAMHEAEMVRRLPLQPSVT